MFGGFLKHSAYMENVRLEDISPILANSADTNNRLQAEFIALVEKAKKIYNQRKTKRKKG
jgi:Ca-activated chloride channel family protein